MVEGTLNITLSNQTVEPRQPSRVVYGYLYNWYAATDSRNIAPSGWHVPTASESDTLRNYNGGWTVNGGHLKEVGFDHWISPNTGADNNYGFNAFGAGLRRGDNGLFSESGTDYLRTCMIIHTTDNYNGTSAYGLSLVNNSDYASSFTSQKKDGYSIRLIKDDSSDPGIVVGNDGKIYTTVKIGSQVWTAKNIAETKYRNGDLITVVTGNSAWLALTTEARCAYNNVESNAIEVAYGLAPTGWHIPIPSEIDTLITTLGGTSNEGGHLKETGLIHWQSPNTGADNSSGFIALPSGIRDSAGSFYGLGTTFAMWLNYSSGGYGSEAELQYNSIYFASDGAQLLNTGLPLRPIKDDSIDPGSVTDYDGNVYKTVKIGNQVWFAANLNVTHYNDGTPIPLVTGNSAWAALTTAGMCYYQAPQNDSASLTPESLTWGYNETDVRTFIVTTNMDRWYFGSTSDWEDFTLTVWDEDNAIQITNGVYHTGYYVRLNPTATNGGTSNKYAYIYIANVSDEILTTFIGTQTYSTIDTPPIVTMECNDGTMTLSAIDHVLAIASSSLWIQFTPSAITPTPPQTIYITVTKYGPVTLASDSIINSYNGVMRSKWITLSEPATAAENIYVQLTTSNA